MDYDPERPLVVQSDRTVYLEVNHPLYAEVRERLHGFAELVKSPEYIHTYRLTPLSLWNAAASGWSSEQVLRVLHQYAKFPIAYAVQQSIVEEMSQLGRYQLTRGADGELLLVSREKGALDELTRYPALTGFFDGDIFATTETGKRFWAVNVRPEHRGDLKQQCIRLGYPVQDEAGYRDGDQLTLSFRHTLPNGRPFQLRPYQREALDAFQGKGALAGGHGVLVLPCGAGKTVIGLAAIVDQQCAALILTPNVTAVKQWKRELLEKTDLSAELIGEYTGELKQIRPVTIATYQVLTHRASPTDAFVHMHLFQKRNWGLIIYDEVHLLPAPVFRATASIQSTRRLGLTATLVREDGRAEDVFSLIGPKRYDLPWKKLESEGFIATAFCTEVKVDFDDALRQRYYTLPKRQRMRLAQENPHKVEIVKQLLAKHEGAAVLIIGQYVRQLEALGMLLDIPVITGKMKQEKREVLFERFRQGDIPVLAVSKVANFAIDLPDAEVAIQISGAFGSRQEEAQRLGRILRPKEGENEAYFYHIVTKDSEDEEYAAKRQLFLVEQGYRYQLMES